jgi:hypothetical protein
MALLRTIYILGGSVLIVLSVPLIFRRIPPNSVYGFRIRWIMEDPELWYSVNAHTGKWVAFVGVCAILGAVGLSLIPGISVSVYAFACLGFFAASFALALLEAIRFLRMQDGQK